MASKKIILLYLLGFVSVALALFAPAGSFDYWQAWVFMAVLFTPPIFVIVYFSKRDPELLKRRMQFKEKEIRQKMIIKISSWIFAIGMFVPGLDYRYGWSSVPVWLVILSDIIVFLGYLLIFFVFKENSYASRIIEVRDGQKVITTGPYSVIRHPMYVGVTLMYVFMPIALGSYWALIFFVPIIGILVFRILNEEKVLCRGLAGYEEYMKKVRYRLVPGIW